MNLSHQSPAITAAYLEYCAIRRPKWGDIKQVAAKHNVSTSGLCSKLSRMGHRPRLRLKEAA
jgi:hypothetical protein